MNQLDINSLYNLSLYEGYILLDVRSPSEYCFKHITGSFNIPLYLSIDKISKKYLEIFEYYCPENTNPIVFITNSYNSLKEILNKFYFLSTFELKYFSDMKNWPEFLSSNSEDNEFSNIYYEFDQLEPYPSCILENVYLGNRENAYNNTVIKNLGITHILSLNKDAKYKHGIFQMNYPINDDENENIIQAYSSVKEFLNQAYEKGKLLIHCDKGKSRSVAILILFLRNKMNYTFEKILTFIKTQRKIAQPNPGFMGQIKSYFSVYEGRESPPLLCNYIHNI